MNILKNKSSLKYRTTVWNNKEVSQLLSAYGLPKDASLSVVVVETLPQINNIFDHMTGLNQPQVAQTATNLVSDDQKKRFTRSTIKGIKEGRHLLLPTFRKNMVVK